MFLLHIAIFLGFLALAAGVSLYLWSASTEGPGSGFGKVIGIIIGILSIFHLGFLGYFGFEYWRQGYFKTPLAMHGSLMQEKSLINPALEGNKATNKSRHKR